MANSKAKTKKSLTQTAYDEISKWLLNGELKPGEALVETELAERLQISRTPVREALLKLSKEGLIEIFPGRGAFVSRITLKDMKELYEIREALEGIAARLASQQVDVSELHKFQVMFDQAEKAKSDDDYLKKINVAGDKLHDYIIATCGNDRIIQIINTYRTMLQKERQIASSIPGRIEKSFQEHKAILEALLAKDPDLAERAMRKHIVGTLNSILEANHRVF